MDDQGLVIPPPLDYPPPNYAVYDADHARTLPHPHRHKDISGHSTLGRSSGKCIMDERTAIKRKNKYHYYFK